MKKRVLIFAVCAVLLTVFATSCAPPALDDPIETKSASEDVTTVRERLEYLIENSREANVLLFGEGLVSYYDISGINDEYNHVWEELYGEDYYYTQVPAEYKTDDDGDGEKETVHTQINTIAAIKAEAEKYYSSSYLSNLYITVFEGNPEIGQRARYIEDEESGALAEYPFSVNYLENGQTKYDYTTMKIVPPSSANTLIVELDGTFYGFHASTGNIGTETETVRLIFVMQDGQWYLDGPSY